MAKPPGSSVPTGAKQLFRPARQLGAAHHVEFLLAVEDAALVEVVGLRDGLARAHLGHHELLRDAADGLDPLDLDAGERHPVRQFPHGKVVDVDVVAKPADRYFHEILLGVRP